MRQWQGIGGQISTIKDLELRSALKRLDDHAADINAAITLLSQNKGASAAQPVVARPYIPEAESKVTGTEAVNVFTYDAPNTVGDLVDTFSTKPTPGMLIVNAFVKEIANAGVGVNFTLGVQYGYAGGTENTEVINQTIATGGILTATVPIYSDGSIPISLGVDTTSNLEYDLRLNIMAV